MRYTTPRRSSSAGRRPSSDVEARREPRGRTSGPSAGGALLLSLIAILPLASTTARAASFEAGAGLRVEHAMRDWKSLRDQGLVRQAWDYSCGSAALATLLTLNGDPVREAEILRAVLAPLDETERWQTMEQGLSLLDLKRVAEARGFEAEGYRVEADVLERLDRPAIVFVQPEGYPHFAVFLGTAGDRVLLSDPAKGNVRMPSWRFLPAWRTEGTRGIVFLIGRDGDVPAGLAGFDPRPERIGLRGLLRIRPPRTVTVLP